MAGYYRGGTCMRIAGLLEVSPEMLDDIKEMHNYMLNHDNIRRNIIRKLEKDQFRVIFNYASTVLELISAKEEIKHLKKQLKNENKDSDYYS